MWVFGWEKELKLHNHNPLDCLRSALKWLRKLYNLSARSRAEKHRTERQSWMQQESEQGSGYICCCPIWNRGYSMPDSCSHHRQLQQRTLGPSYLSNHFISCFSKKYLSQKKFGFLSWNFPLKHLLAHVRRNINFQCSDHHSQSKHHLFLS